MAQLALKLADNVDGEFFVDSTCIDCDACRQIAPTVFHDIGDQSAVYHQPETEEELLAAQKALISCPTASIGDVSKRDMTDAIAGLPEHIDDDVSRCGYTSESAFGAISDYLQATNVLRDSPRFTGCHLAWNNEREQLYAFRSACWYSWNEQIESMARLLAYRFEWVLPGHGRPIRLTAEEMHAQLEQCVAWMKKRA